MSQAQALAAAEARPSVCMANRHAAALPPPVLVHAMLDQAQAEQLAAAWETP
jgi:hypothetical protein